MCEEPQLRHGEGGRQNVGASVDHKTGAEDVGLEFQGPLQRRPCSLKTRSLGSTAVQNVKWKTLEASHPQVRTVS